MKILCLDRPLPGATFEKYQPHLQDEVRHVWRVDCHSMVSLICLFRAFPRTFEEGLEGVNVVTGIGK
jgi:hypothetical protein